MPDETPPNLVITLLQEIRARLDAHDRRFDAMDARFDRFDARFDETDDRFDALEREMRTGFAQASAERADLAARISRLDADATEGFTLIKKQLDGHRDFASEVLQDHEARIRKLEGRPETR